MQTPYFFVLGGLFVCFGFGFGGGAFVLFVCLCFGGFVLF